MILFSYKLTAKIIRMLTLLRWVTRECFKIVCIVCMNIPFGKNMCLEVFNSVILVIFDSMQPSTSNCKHFRQKRSQAPNYLDLLGLSSHFHGLFHVKNIYDLLIWCWGSHSWKRTKQWWKIIQRKLVAIHVVHVFLPFMWCSGWSRRYASFRRLINHRHYKV